MDRTRPPLAPVAALVLLLSPGLASAGCGGDERDAVRDRAQRYLESEQSVMRRAQPDFERANRTYLAFAKGELEPEIAGQQVKEAERAIRNARDGVLVLDPPPVARPLHDSLVRYLDMNVELAGETTRLARYVPAAATALAPLDRAGRRLQARLADADGGGDQVRILKRFQAAVGSIVADLKALDAPAVLEPAHAEQVRRLGATRRLAGRLRGALLAQDAERVSVLLRRFRSSMSQPSGRRLLADRALKQYDRRLRRLARASADTRREHADLARALG